MGVAFCIVNPRPCNEFVVLINAETASTPPVNVDNADTLIVPVIVVFVALNVDEFEIPTQVNKPAEVIDAVVAGVAF